MQEKSKPDRDASRVVFIVAASSLALGLAFGVGFYSAWKHNVVYRKLMGLKNTFSLAAEERENLVPDGTPVHFLQPSRKPGDGVTVNSLPDDGAMVMIAGFFDGGNQIRLVKRDGTIVAKWPIAFSDHFPDPSHMRLKPATDRNIDTHGALMLPDGSVVFNWEYGGTVKLSRCNDVVWTVPLQTHHSIERAEEGGFWIADRRFMGINPPDLYPPITELKKPVHFPEDLILHVDDDGNVLEMKSVPELLWENGFQALMTANGMEFNVNGDWEDELVHLNKIGELPSDIAAAFPMFEAGDLILSLRTHNLVFVVDPDDWKIKWHQTGPWLRQHDPEFNADGTITVFNNNIFLTALGEYDRSIPGTPLVSNILKMDPATRETEIAVGERPGQEFLSVIRGKQQPLPDGGFLITEFEGGRVFETDASGNVVWEYIDRYDADWVVEVTEGRLYPADYFTVDDWSCPAPT